ncbi:unnamed protein product [Periconia digitata]|uniref:NACHT domain-containing protein n=1 Tax=Periconia digitata TaxID=1303443 RepID=A0A9W4U8E5_9PLEO|nr:unnamed protein product [Periconia digitata]
MAQLAVRPDHPIDFWARAAHKLSDRDKQHFNLNRPDKLNILAELYADAERCRQRSLENRWKYTRKNGETVIIRDVLEKIIRWVDMFKQVGDVAVQYDPVHASLPWAGVRFLLQIAVNDINKYASVVEDLARIAELICRFHLTEQLYLWGTTTAVKELEKAIIILYTKILELLCKLKRYLEQRTLKRTMKSALLTDKDLGSNWKEVEEAEGHVDRCISLVDRSDDMKNHEKLLDLLARINQPLRRMDNNLRYMHDDLETMKRTRIVQWLSPEPYLQHHKQALQGVLPGTGQWLLSDPVFKAWIDDSASSILWLHGIPGSGKSKLVSVVIQDAMARYEAGNTPHPVFFYCSRNPTEPTRSDPQAILASLARQLSCIEPGKPLLKPTVDLFSKSEDEQFASGSLQMEESFDLVLQLIEQYPVVTIVIDAMDECNPDKRHELLKALEQILQRSSTLVKIFVSSRNDQDLVLRLQHYPNLEIDSRRNSDDIARFVEANVEQLIQDGNLLQYSDSRVDMKKLIVDKVIEGADGMFRWASLQLQYLCSFELDDDIKSNLGRLPPDLNTLYDELYKVLSTKPGRFSAIILKNSLSLLLCAQQKMSTTEFISVVSVDTESGTAVKITSKDLVLKICGSFIVFDQQMDTFRLAHLSVREYLEQQPKFSRTMVNALAAEICLWNLLSFCPRGGATEHIMNHVGWQATTLDSQPDKLKTYSDRYWVEHCARAREQRDDKRLRCILRHVLSGSGGLTSPIALWARRIRGLDLDDDDPSGSKDTQNPRSSVERWADQSSWSYATRDQVSTNSLWSNHTQNPHSSVAKWADRFKPEFWGYDLSPWRRMPRSIRSEMCVGLLVACTFNLNEFIPDMVEASMGSMQNEVLYYDIPLLISMHQFSYSSIEALLTTNPDRMRITEKVVDEAIRKDDDARALTLLFQHHERDIPITEKALIAAAMIPDGREAMSLLLEKGRDRISITPEVATAIIGNPTFGNDIFKLLLNQRGEGTHAQQIVLIAAMKTRDKSVGMDIVAMILDQYEAEIKVTKELVLAVMRSGQGHDPNRREYYYMSLLLRLAKAEQNLAEDAISVVAESFDERFVEEFLGDRPTTKRIARAAARNQTHAVEVMTYLLNRKGGASIPITESIVKAAARNETLGDKIMVYLFFHSNESIKITESIVKAAARNENLGHKIMTFLLTRSGRHFPITEKVMTTVVRNSNSGAKMMNLLIEHRKKDIRITKNVLDEISSNPFQGKFIMLNLCHNGLGTTLPDHPTVRQYEKMTPQLGRFRFGHNWVYFDSNGMYW